jgi:WD domain, G-beta repeat
VGASTQLQLEREWREGYGSHLAYSADGRAFATVSPQRLNVFEDDRPIASAPAPGVRLSDVRFGPGDREVLAAPAVYDRGAGAWAPIPVLRDALVGDLEPERAAGFAVHSAAWGPDGRTLVLYAEYRPPRGIGAGRGTSGPDVRVVAVDGRSGAAIARLWEGRRPDKHGALAVHGDVVAAAGKAIEVAGLPDGRPLARLDGFKTIARVVRFSADGSLLAAGAADGTVAAWDVATWRQLASWQAHQEEAAGLAFHPGGGMLATGGAEGVRVWTPEGGRLGEAAVSAPVEGLAFHPDGGRLLVARSGPDEALLAFSAPA